jgi:hypothetical protein
MGKLIADIAFGKGFFEGSTPTDGMCQGCCLRYGEHIHHKEFKAMGGCKGKSKTKSATPENKTRLCEVCHRATHGLVYIASDGFSCRICPKRATCYFGAHITGRPTAHLSRPW